MKKALLFLLLLSVFILSDSIFPVELVLKKSWALEMDDDVMLVGAGRTSVDKDEYFFIPDAKLSNIKIFSNSGKLFSVFGKKGQGPNEFIRPLYSYIYKDEFVVADFGRKMVFLYRINKDKGLTNILSEQVSAVYDVCMDKQKIYMAGYLVKEGKENEVFSLDKSDKSIETYLPLAKKYTPIGNLEYRKKNIPEFAAVGIQGYVCVFKDHLFYAWIGDLRIHKINIHSKAHSLFGEKTKNYIRPFISSRMKKGILERNWKMKMEERNKMSSIDSIMVNSRYVILTYHSPDKSLSRRVRYFQFYDHDGNLKSEFPAPEKLRFGDEDEGISFFLREDILYAERRYVNEDEDEIFEVLKYEIK